MIYVKHLKQIGAKAIALLLTLCMLLTCSATLVAEAVEAIAEASTTTFSVTSPDGKTVITLTNSDSGLTYTVEREGVTVVKPSVIGFETNEASFTGNFSFVSKTDVTLIDETWQKYSGNYSIGHNYCNERSVTFANSTYLYTVILRAYNDGIAFRSEISQASGEAGTITVTDEKSNFVFPAGTTVRAQEIPAANMNGSDSTYSYETGSYTTYDISATTGEYLAFATLCQVNGLYVLVNEADLYGDSFYGSCFYGAGNNTLELHPAPAVFGAPLTVSMDPVFTSP